MRTHKNFLLYSKLLFISLFLTLSLSCIIVIIFSANAAHEKPLIYSYIEILITVLFIALLTTLYLKKVLIDSLISLTKTMKTVTEQNDYSLRIDEENGLGKVSDTFNSMLSEIEQNDKLQRTSQEQIKRLAYYDTLTGLPNRDLFKELVHPQLVDAARKNQLLAIFYIDLDNFNLILDSLGHEMGDQLLQMAVQKIKNCLLTWDPTGENITLARFNSDEFIVALKNVESVEVVETIAQYLISSSFRPYTLNDKEVLISESIGVTIFPEHADNYDALIKFADTAMYCAKENG